ncbi:hypothetical protein NPIL_208941 [Nephila pilipes]|uniref:Uncharacterized protein n=1 Tax=Nephila pilipes TaxID=299642 RepID=A0A8X6NMD1_NEPPI|nr:hypothetical protein NPIL_208941 [Nephila pilipes]
MRKTDCIKITGKFRRTGNILVTGSHRELNRDLRVERNVEATSMFRFNNFYKITPNYNHDSARKQNSSRRNHPLQRSRRQWKVPHFKDSTTPSLGGPILSPGGLQPPGYNEQSVRFL